MRIETYTIIKATTEELENIQEALATKHSNSLVMESPKIPFRVINRRGVTNVSPWTKEDYDTYQEIHRELRERRK